MVLGLVRHFSVIMPEKKLFYNASDFSGAMDTYDRSPVKTNGVDLGGYEWEVCYSSSLPRAVATAKNIFAGEIIETDLIREVPMSPFTDSGILLPSFVWHIGARIAWFNNKESQPETRAETFRRIEKFVDLLEQSGKVRILIVTHGFFMRVFTEHLAKHGFRGKIDDRPRNGRLYVYNKN